MTALNTAFTFTEVDCTSVAVRENLDLNVL
jgi:hypothetical protein